MLDYKGIAYRQSNKPDAPWVASIVVPAEELLHWAAIPRRTEAHLLGFQRAADPDRVDRAHKFFLNPLNQSPTALVIGIHPSKEAYLVAKLGEEISPNIRNFSLSVDIKKIDSMSLKEASTLVLSTIESRLSTQNVFDEEGSIEPEQTDIEGEEAGDSIEDGEDGASGEVELGESVLDKLSELMKSETWVVSNEDLIRDLAKPATIIDGQHRVLGAAACEREIPFCVCAILDCSWAEQVFQFTVVNYTAKGIPDAFITANAALSLTESELKSLEGRLLQANVKVLEYELMRIVNFDSRSSFYQLVNLTEKPVLDKIGYKTMVRIARVWHKAKAPAIEALLSHLYPELDGLPKNAQKKERMLRWNGDDWGEFFIKFWTSVKNVYFKEASYKPGKMMWEVGESQMMVAVVLERLQHAFLENLAQQDDSFYIVNGTTNEIAKAQLLEKIQTRAETFFKSDFPPEFFQKEWKTKSLSTGAGRVALDDAFSNMVKKKGKWGYATSALVTGKTS